MPSDRVLIVGGGLSGLATAYFLARGGIRSTIIEKANRIGGLIKTDVIQGCTLEAGPDSYIATKPAVTELAEELPGLRGQIIGSNDAARRVFIVRKGEMTPLPRGMAMMVPGQWGPLLRSRLLSTQSKLRAVKELFIRPRERAEDISVGQLVEEHFGKEVLEYVTEPLLGGVYGGDAASLSAQSVLPRFLGYERRYGSLIKGVRREVKQQAGTGSLFLSLRAGMQTLTDALAAAIAGEAAVVQAEATQVTRSDGGWRVRVGGESISARDVVLACPAYASAKLLEGSAKTVAADLAEIPYSSAILVTLVFERAKLGHEMDGFGFLVPCKERQTIAAATWVNTKFPTRMRGDLAALRGFVVGGEAAGLLNSPEQDVLALVREDFRRLMGTTATPLLSTVYAWPKSMPQYVVGHGRRQQNIAQNMLDFPGLHLGGNAYDGVGLSDCVRRAKETAQLIMDRRV